ncbi:MAG: porin, partial [Janthinobacterium lividum]
PQITYASPTFSGIQVSAGVFTPLATAGRSEVNSTPGFQGKVTYDYKGEKIAVHAWLGGLTQKHDQYLGVREYTGDAVDGGVKLTYGPVGLAGYYYTGKGVGTTGLFILATDDLGNKRKSDGFYVQGTLGFGKVTLAGSYGESNLDEARGEINPLLVSRNSSYVGQLRYGLTPWVTLLTEYTHTKSSAQGINEADSDSIATGAILFF